MRPAWQNQPEDTCRGLRAARASVVLRAVDPLLWTPLCLPEALCAAIGVRVVVGRYRNRRDPRCPQGCGALLVRWHTRLPGMLRAQPPTGGLPLLSVARER